MEPAFEHTTRSLRTAALVALAVAVSACAIRGPQLTPVSHLAYNEAVQISEQRELLLNLVRLRYTDAPEFLAINSIASHVQFDARASINGSFGKDRDGTTRLLIPSASAAYSESPTVTFSPLRSEDFIRRLVTPVDIDIIYLLTRYGWSLERTLRLVAEQINGVRNPAPRETATVEDMGSIEQFARLATLIQSLNARHLLQVQVADRWAPLSSAIPPAQVSTQDFVTAAANGHRLVYDEASASYVLQSPSEHYVLELTTEALRTPELAEIVSLLALQPGELTYELGGQASGSALAIRTRSVFAAMTYAAQGVAVLNEEIDQGFAAPSTLPDTLESPFLEVRISDIEPTEAFIAVPYRGRWYYVDDTDLESKRTLGALGSLIRLQVGAGGAQTIPVLTLPVAR